MGGQMDIDNNTKCHLLESKFPDEIINKYFMKPKGFTDTENTDKTINKPFSQGGIL